MSVVDDYGRFDGRISVLRANCYPLKLDLVSDADVRKWRSETVKAGVVSVYHVDGKEYVQIEKFNQRMRGKPRWPAPLNVGDSPQVAASCSTSRLSSYSETETEAETVKPPTVSTPTGAGGTGKTSEDKPKAIAPQAVVGEHYRKRWKRRYAAEANNLTKEDCIKLAGVMKQPAISGDVAKARTAVDRYLDDEDHYVTEARHPLGLFVSRLASYIVTDHSATGGVPEDYTPFDEVPSVAGGVA